MPFHDDVLDDEPRALPHARVTTVDLRGPERALLRALMLRTGLNESEVLRVALLGLAAPRRFGGQAR